MCSSFATVRGLLDELDEEDVSLVIVDAEASPEHLSRGTIRSVDVQLIVAEPFFKSLETARHYAHLGRDLGIPHVRIVANKVRNESDDAAIREFCDTNGIDLAASVPYDESLGGAERAGVAPVDHDLEAPSVKAIAALLDDVLGATTVG